MNDKSWIAWVVTFVVVAALAIGFSSKVPCSWYDNAAQKNVPNRCAK